VNCPSRTALIVIILNLRRGVAAGDKVVHLLGGLGRPLGMVGAEGAGADGRGVPQEAIIPVGGEGGYAGLRIAVAQFKDRALLVQFPVLVLAHTKDHLVIKGLKAGGKCKIIGGGNGLEFARRNAQERGIPIDMVVVVPVFLYEQFALLVTEGEPAFPVDLNGRFAVAQRVHLAHLVIMRPLFPLVPRAGRVDLF